MNRFIDADALFDAMEETEWYDNADRDEIAERLIMDAPTIDIVRCGECKHRRGRLCGRRRYTHFIRLDDFCSYGSRSEKPNNLERSSDD